MVADRLEVRLDPEHRRKLAELAQAHGATVSTLVREWIDQAYQGVDRARRVRAAARIAELQVEEMPDPDTLSRQLDGRYESTDLR